MSAPLSFQEESPPILSTRVSALRKYFPLNSREYHRSADEYATYLILLEGLFRSLERSAPSMRLLPALHSTLRVHDHREAVRLRDFVRRFVKHLLERHHETLKALLRIFLDQSLDDRLTENIRFAIMEKLALPLLWDLVASPQSCKECWLAHWSLLVQHADPDVSFAQLRMRDVEALNLKVQEMAGIYGMIEVLFVRTAPDQLKEQIMPELQSSPSRDIILIAKRALKKPTGWERVALPSLRRCQLRIYAALSAAIGATQTKQEMYTGDLQMIRVERWGEPESFALREGWLFEKVLWDETMIEPWEGASGASIALDTLKPESNYNSFPRPGYSFAYLSAAVPGRTPAARARAARGAEESTLLGAGLWAATPAPMTQTSLRFAGGLGTLGRAAAAKASQELTLMLPEKQRRQLATASKGTASQVISLVVTGSSDGLTQGEGVPLPPGEEGQALRLQAVLAGRRLSGVAGETDRGATWQTEWLEHDEVIFPDGPTNDCALTLFLVLLRTLDVLTERFGVPSGANHLSGSWLQSLLAIVDKASTDFRLRILLLKVFIHRADVMQPVLYGRNVEIFRFLLSMLLDPRFGAEKRFHYLARDVVSTLLVPKLDSEVQAVTLPRDCLMDCQRLLHQLQALSRFLRIRSSALTAPHRTTYWQKAHLGILRLFAAQYLRREQLNNEMERFLG
ncbi:unnamed protein product [Durusdinium trenchii]|uniref:Uncharacterized protein n=1 Tax=Durusdinium trenchii TaxID=1381693 RepID=A0ABP0PED0_9DINO